MDVEKLLKLATENFSVYFSTLMNTIRLSKGWAIPLNSNNTNTLIQVSNNAQEKSRTLNPMLFEFMVISIFLGGILNSLIPRKPSSPNILTIVVVTLFIWFVYAITVNSVSRILKGTGDFLESISASLQILAAVYVISNLIVYVFGLIASLRFINLIKIGIFNFIISQPFFLYYIIQFILISIYLPKTLGKIHRIGIFRQMLLVLISLMWTIFFTYSFFDRYIYPLTASFPHPPQSEQVESNKPVLPPVGPEFIVAPMVGSPFPSHNFEKIDYYYSHYSWQFTLTVNLNRWDDASNEYRFFIDQVELDCIRYGDLIRCSGVMFPGKHVISVYWDGKYEYATFILR